MCKPLLELYTITGAFEVAVLNKTFFHLEAIICWPPVRKMFRVIISKFCTHGLPDWTIFDLFSTHA